MDYRDRIFNGIFHSFNIDFVVFDNRVRSTRVAVARQADAAGVDNEFVAYLQNIRLMRVADAHHVGVYVSQSARPKLRVGRGVFVKRIPRRGVDQEKPGVFQRRHASGRQARQVTQVRFLQKLAQLAVG